MTSKQMEFREGLVRVSTTRRGAPVELRVHYAVGKVNGCATYRIISVEDPN